MKTVIAFTGNASVGKTTVLMRLVYDLKVAKIKVGYLADSIRGTLMDMKYADLPEGRRLILFRHLENEMIQILRPDTNVLLLDRSVIDWYIYLLHSCHDLPTGTLYSNTHVYEQLMLNEARKYAAIFHFVSEGFDYVQDGFRPPDDSLREQVEPLYNSILRSMADQNYPITVIGGTSVPVRYEAAKQALSVILRRPL